MIGGKVLDTSALVQFARRRSVYAHAVVWSAVDGDAVLAVPTVALARAWASIDPDHHAAMDVLVGLPVTVLDHLDSSAREVGLLLAGSGCADVVTGAVAWCALRRGWPVVTAEPGPLRSVDHTIQIEHLP
ncbi:MAG TPA: hypothetical protein VIR27_20140 [Mycobacteriales bacterium]